MIIKKARNLHYASIKASKVALWIKFRPILDEILTSKKAKEEVELFRNTSDLLIVNLIETYFKFEVEKLLCQSTSLDLFRNFTDPFSFFEESSGLHVKPFIENMIRCLSRVDGIQDRDMLINVATQTAFRSPKNNEPTHIYKKNFVLFIVRIGAGLR